jgi:hypothetical protein
MKPTLGEFISAVGIDKTLDSSRDAFYVSAYLLYAAEADKRERRYQDFCKALENLIKEKK